MLIISSHSEINDGIFGNTAFRIELRTPDFTAQNKVAAVRHTVWKQRVFLLPRLRDKRVLGSLISSRDMMRLGPEACGSTCV